MTIKFVDSSSQATNGEGWTKVPEFKTKGTSVQKGGVTHIIVAQEYKMVSLFKRISNIVLACLTLGSALIFDNVRNICFYGKKVTDFAVSATQLEIEKKKALEDAKEKIITDCTSEAMSTLVKTGAAFFIGGFASLISAATLPISAPFFVAGAKQFISSRTFLDTSFAVGSIASANIALSSTTDLKENKKFVAAVVTGIAASAASGLVADGTNYLSVPALISFATLGVICSMIVNHFNAKEDKLIAELDKKAAPAQA